MWQITYLEAIESWLDDLSAEHLKSIGKEIYLLGHCGNQLKLPHSKSLGDGIFELRERRFGIRLYYCFQKNNSVLILHGGNKDSQGKDIQKARALLKQVSRSS